MTTDTTQRRRLVALAMLVVGTLLMLIGDLAGAVRLEVTGLVMALVGAALVGWQLWTHFRHRSSG